MKRFVVALFLVASTALAHHDEVIKRGKAVTDQKATPLADIVARPEAYVEKAVVVEGVVEKVCKKMGCWMELAPESGAAGIRVSFDDFVIPIKSAGMSVRAGGVAKVKTLTKAEADHLEENGAKIARHDDGTAREVSFHATGVELKK